LTRLRADFKVGYDALVEAQSALADQQTEIDRIERRFGLRLGRLVERLEALEAEVDRYRQELQRRQNQEAYDAGYLPVEEQYRRAWYQPPMEEPAASEPTSPLTDEKRIKRLYRQLARRYHPDLASDPGERAFRTERMAALNEAYEARSMIELIALGSDADTHTPGEQGQQTTQQMITVLEEELVRLRRRHDKIKRQLETLHLHPAVRLSLDVKLARRSGRDLMGEMAANIKKKITIMQDERDRLKERLGIGD